jgi:hypothetical protein
VAQGVGPLGVEDRAYPVLDLGHEVLGDAHDLVAALGRADQLGPAVGRIGYAGDVPVCFQVRDELGHRLLGDLGAFGEHADGGAGVVEVLEDRTVYGPDGAVAAFGQALQHQGVEADVDLAHEHGEIGRSPPALGHRETG